MVTVGDSEVGLAQKLVGLLKEVLPQTEGHAIRVEIHELKEGRSRKKRRDASRDSWYPESGEIVIKFEGPAVFQTPYENTSPANQQERESNAFGSQVSEKADQTEGRLADFIKALNSAEQRPGFDFVALRWFRDVFLPAEGYEWAESPTERDKVLRHAIESRLALTSKVPNPKDPRFPVTAIRLNRLQPDVKAVLGGEGVDSGFYPINIRGETLSSTVLGERR